MSFNVHRMRGRDGSGQEWSWTKNDDALNRWSPRLWLEMSPSKRREAVHVEAHVAALACPYVTAATGNLHLIYVCMHSCQQYFAVFRLTGRLFTHHHEQLLAGSFQWSVSFCQRSQGCYGFGFAQSR